MFSEVLLRFTPCQCSICILLPFLCWIVLSVLMEFGRPKRPKVHFMQLLWIIKFFRICNYARYNHNGCLGVKQQITYLLVFILYYKHWFTTSFFQLWRKSAGKRGMAWSLRVAIGVDASCADPPSTHPPQTGASLTEQRWGARVGMQDGWPLEGTQGRLAVARHDLWPLPLPSIHRSLPFLLSPASTEK